MSKVTSRELIAKAIVDVDAGKPIDFKAKIEQATTLKLKTAIDKAVKEKEAQIFQKK